MAPSFCKPYSTCLVVDLNVASLLHNRVCPASQRLLNSCICCTSRLYIHALHNSRLVRVYPLCSLGASPHICLGVQARAAVLTASQCATYDEVKQTLIKFTGAGDNFGTHLSSSMITGLVTTTATAPVDVIKTHMFVGKRQSCSSQAYLTPGQC